MILSLDIETYGACERDWLGRALPPQTSHHPARSRHTDNPPALLLTCSVTEVYGEKISDWTPGTTRIYNLWEPDHAALLRKWLHKATTLVGTNLLFDILYLLDDSRFRYALGSQSLIDLTILNYLHNEQRPEKSLKSLCQLFGIHTYDTTLKDGKRFPLPSDPKFREYNARDSHHTVEACAEVARRIAADHPDSAKLSPYCLDFYSNAIWTAVRMASAGVPFSLSALSALEKTCLDSILAAEMTAQAEGIVLSGEGSNSSKYEFVQRLVDEVSCHNHPLLQFTEKTRKISFCVENMVLLRNLLPPSHPSIPTLSAIEERSRASKLVTSYLCPMLRHKSKDPDDTSSVLIPLPSNPKLGVAYPSIYIVPSQFRDEAGEGGQLQVRYSFKKPALQTLPPPVKKCIRSRFGRDGVVLACDLSQIDLRSAGIQSGEPVLLDNYRRGGDLHTARAIELFGPNTINDPHFGCGDMRTDPRQWGKRENFAGLNWAGATTMRRSHFEVTGQVLDLDFFINIVRTRPTSRPVLYAWQEETLARARREGVLYLPFTGVSRYFEGLAEEHRSEAVNFPIQGVSSHVMRRLQAYLNKRLPPVWDRNAPIILELDVHDAAFLDCRRSHEQEARQMMQDAIKWLETEDYWAMLSAHTGHSLPLGIECKILSQGDHE